MNPQTSPIRPAERILSLPPYLFAELDRLKNEAMANGVDVIDLGVGDPDLPTPDFVINALNRASQEIDNHHYPSYVGMPSFRQAVVDWYKRRFSVELDANHEVLTLIGSKEGIAHLPLAMVNSGDRVVVPDIGYPVYAIASGFVGGEVAHLPLIASHGFLPDLESAADILHGSKLLFLNYPNNPTAATCDVAFFTRVVKAAKEHGFVVCHDNAYSELYYDGKIPPSFLQAKGAKEVGIEMHSLSKSFNMTGWRIGFAVGNRDIIAALGKVKTNVDSGVFQAVQVAGMAALQEGDDFLREQRQTMQQRRDCLATLLKEAGFRFVVPAATFYFWVEVPSAEGSVSFSRRVLQEAGVVVTPGVGMGDAGDRFFRLTITTPVEKLEEAGRRLKKFAC